MSERPESLAPAQVLSTATLNAARALDIRQSDLADILGRTRSRLRDGIEPTSKSGELALMFVRVYRALYALFGGDKALMAQWVRTDNLGTGGIPAEQMRSIVGLSQVIGYLDAMRGRI